jgi:hypothetical protein
MIKDAKAGIALLLLAAIPFVPTLLSSDEFIYGGDIDYFFPHEKTIRHGLQQGVLPLWTPYFGGGSPQLGKIQVGLLYPPSMILRSVLPIVPMFNWDAVLHLFLAGLGVYVLLRDFGVGRGVSTYCGTVFMFAGTTIPRVSVGHVSVVHTVVWIGWLLFAYKRLLHRPSWGSLLLTVMFVSLVILGGHPQFGIIILLVPVSYFVLAFSPTRLRHRDWKGVGKGFLHSALAGLLAAGLLAVQLLPFGEWLEQTNRGKGIAFSSFEYMTRHSFNPEHLLTLLFPLLWFDPVYEPVTLASVGISGVSHFWEVSPFVSISALVLMLISVSLGTSKRKSHTCYFVGLALVGLVMSMGRLNPIYQLVYSKAPYFRAPGRFIILWTFSLTILVGLYTEGLSELVEAPSRRTRLKKPMYLAGCLCLVGIALTVLWAAMGGDIVSIVQGRMTLAQGSASLLMRSFQFSFLLFTATMGLISALLWIGQRRSVAPQWRQLLAFSVMIGEMILFASLLVKPYPVDRLFDTNHPLAQLGVDAAGVRIPGYREPPNYLLPTLEHVKNGEEHYALQSLVDVGSRGEHLLSAGYIASSELVKDPYYELVRQVDSAFLYRHVDSLPRIYAAPAVDIVATDTEALAFVTHDSFAPYEQVAVTIPSSDSFLKQQLSFQSRVSQPAAFTAEYLAYENDSLAARVVTDRPVMVVFSEMYYPGWQATVDGQPTTIWKANYTFRGIIVSEGEHVIEMRFRPPVFRLGLTVTLVTVAIILFGSAGVAVRASQQR